MRFIQYLRTWIFYLLLALMTLAWSTIGLLFGFFVPFAQRYRLINQAWAWQAVWLARWIVGIRYELIGREHIPKTPCVILAKHQSTWETFYFSALFAPLSQVVKRELLYVPIWGWAMSSLRPIAIDRDNPKAALKQLASEGAARLQEGCWVLIFPEGTRIAQGEIGKFSKGGAALAVQANLPVLPIAHNAGACWPKDGWLKHPGVIQVMIGPPLYPQESGPRGATALNEQAFAWIRTQQIALGACTANSPIATSKTE